MNRIRAVVINEAVHTHKAFFYLALLVNDSSNLTLIFQVSPPHSCAFLNWSISRAAPLCFGSRRPIRRHIPSAELTLFL